MHACMIVHVYSLPTETQSYMMPAAAVWYTAMTENASPLQHILISTSSPSAYSLVLDNYNLDLHQDVDVDNCIDIYMFLVNNIDA